MSLEIIIPIAAAIILYLLFTWLLTVLKSTIKTVLVIVAILILLQVTFGVNSEQIIQGIMQIVERVQKLIFGS
jgi:predicted PurR-regulated permease PerM